MCELLAVCSNQPIAVDFSLQRFASHGGNAGPYRDGWGIAVYEGRDVRLIKEARAAGESDWIRFLDRHPLRSPITIAHLRRATVGADIYANTQPFLRELGGRMQIFAHNGHLKGLQESGTFPLGRYHPVGDTDSEWAFCALLERIAECWQETPGTVPPLQRRFELVSAFAAAIRPFGPANFLYTDGDAVFAHGHRRFNSATGEVTAPGLVSLSRWCRGNARGFITKGLAITGSDQLVTMIASVPLTDDRWVPLAEGEVLAIHGGQRTTGA